MSGSLKERARLELAEVVADLADRVAWEKGGGGQAFPRTPATELVLPPLEEAPAASAPAAPRSATARFSGPRTATPPPTGDAAEANDLDTLRAVLGDCRRCELSGGRHSIVFGQGNPDADLMLVGEAPGFHEDRQGLAFVGPAGDLLTKILGAIQISREDVYICNIVKCRPPQNRDPLPEEVAACRPFVDRQIALVKPRVILALGRIAGQTLLGTEDALWRLRGRFHDYGGIPLRVTYHPAALLRDKSKKRPVWEDVQEVRDRLAQP